MRKRARILLLGLWLALLTGCHVKNFGAREPMDATAEAILRRDCTDIRRLGSVEDLQRALSRNIHAMLTLASQRPVDMLKMKQALARIETTSAKLRALASPAWTNPKWNVRYLWTISADDLLRDSGNVGRALIKPARIHARDGRIFSLKSPQILQRLEIMRVADGEAVSFDVILPLQASSFDLCILENTLAIDAKVEFATTLGSVESDIALLLKSEGDEN